MPDTIEGKYIEPSKARCIAAELQGCPELSDENSVFLCYLSFSMEKKVSLTCLA